MITIGCDEVNFSPSLAGDCVAVSLWLPNSPTIPGVGDSKKLTENQRLKVFAEIQNLGLYSVVPANITVIRELGIYQARNWAMEESIFSLAHLLQSVRIISSTGELRVLVDGKDIHLRVHIPEVVYIVKGDEKEYLIGAASIVAKTYVDALFHGWGKFWPGYGSERNHGSVSKEMRDKILESGPSPIHRRKGYAQNWWYRLLGGK